MLDYKILSKKPIISKASNADGSEYVEFYDLLSSVFNANPEYKSNILWMVNKYYVARPDLVSLAFYGTDEYADIICKINGISNPFELNENDLLIIPNISEIYSLVNSGQKSHIAQSDDDTIMKVDKTFKKNKTDRRSSNEQLTTEKNYVIDRSNNLIFY